MRIRAKEEIEERVAEIVKEIRENSEKGNMIKVLNLRRELDTIKWITYGNIG